VNLLETATQTIWIDFPFKASAAQTETGGRQREERKAHGALCGVSHSCMNYRAIPGRCHVPNVKPRHELCHIHENTRRWKLINDSPAALG
jgi:hypothetical protein